MKKQIQKNPMMNKIYIFDNSLDLNGQMEYIGNMMADIEIKYYNELIFQFDRTYNGYIVEIFEHADELEDDEVNSWDGLELVDNFVSSNLKEIFDFLMRKYI